MKKIFTINISLETVGRKIIYLDVVGEDGRTEIVGEGEWPITVEEALNELREELI